MGHRIYFLYIILPYIPIFENITTKTNCIFVNNLRFVKYAHFYNKYVYFIIIVRSSKHGMACFLLLYVSHILMVAAFAFFVIIQG